MDLGRLRTFHALAETLHFGRAAERLGVTQPAVSQQIAALEKQLGAALFERIGRRVYLTPAGQVLAGEAPKVLAAASRAEDAVAGASRGEVGRLRVGASTTPGIYLLPGVLGRFRARFPRVELRFGIANSSRIEALAVGNELDLAVCGFRPSHEELFEIELGEDDVVAVASPALVGSARRIAAADLARWPYVAREAGSATRATVEAALSELGVRPAPAFELPSPEALLRAAEAGLGYAFVSAQAARAARETRRLVRLRIEGLEARRTIYAVHHRDKRVTPAMRELVDLLRARLRDGDRGANGR
ncbi:MAG TPA: LysR family transcriptional regulator [Anaeromyxobacter sp.]